MLEVHNLCASIVDKTILTDINITVKTGEIHAFLGPNGSGKSTLGRALMADKRLTITGNVRYNGISWDTYDTVKRAQNGYFMTFQQPPEIDGIRVLEMLYAAKKALQKDNTVVSKYKFKKEIIEYMRLMRIDTSFLERDMHYKMSGGEKKKMEMISLLALNPDICFLDELDSGVDRDALEALIQVINLFMTRENKALMIVSHTEKMLLSLPITHTHIIIDGRIVLSGDKNIITEVHKYGFERYK